MMDVREIFHGPNVGYVMELYERYKDDPQSVDEATRALFNHWTPTFDGYPSVRTPTTPEVPSRKIVSVIKLAQAIRRAGYYGAQLDPLGSAPIGDPWATLEFHDVTEEDLRRLPASLLSGPVTQGKENAWEVVQDLYRIYAGKIGYDYDHVRVSEERDWIREVAETERFCPQNITIDNVELLELLTKVETLELFLHRIFPGKTRFSVEGLDMLVPMLKEILSLATEVRIKRALIGMAHRGRINVLAHILDMPYRQLLAMFKDPVSSSRFQYDLGWWGDVKYHAGASLPKDEEKFEGLAVTMSPNPSHLEAVNPVVEGMARAAGTTVDRPGKPDFNSSVTLPILIHGDASFPAQGVVAETLNLSALEGFHTGGTIHIITNNQLGYTTTPEEGRSTIYASDLAKGFRIPIVHVNADSPEDCMMAARMAFAYREKFHKDFVIDLVGYRRYGHNEGDEPSFTQPLMYEKIENHPTVREQWAKTLVERGEVQGGYPEELVKKYMGILQEILEDLDPEKDLYEPKPQLAPKGAAKEVDTRVPGDELQALNQALLDVPDDFRLHRKMKRTLKKRKEILDEPDEKTIDWATAEELALASILEDGISIRFTGEDVERGTFSQRHAVFHDVESGETYTPLCSIPQAKAAFEIYNSPLSEVAVLGFEYGYNIQRPERLVIWEAQYGDFINNAQVIVDEYITSARMKWDQTPSLVLLLPHGSEGAGPDHSSGRLERFLSLAAKTNLRIANCTTAAQYFHLLRRQALLLETDPLPLIVMTPKSLLRHRLVSSSLRELSEGGWQPVINDSWTMEHPEKVKRLLLCSGKIYVDLVLSEHREETPEVGIVRIEQLYSFPDEKVGAVFENYPNLEQVFWVQEEPKNMGGWTFIQPRLEKIIDGRWYFRMVGRYSNASPAEGSASMFQRHQKMVVDYAFDLESEEG